MWVLQPETAGQQQTVYLGTGDISIGRPLKKGSTVGKADILIFNEQSVSTIHATLHVEAAAQQGSQDFTHGSISITDVSKFGTHLTRPGSAEQRLVIKQATPLQDGDVLRFGSKCRYRVQQLAASLVASSSCQAQQPQLRQHAAALNMQLSSSWQHTAVAGLGTGTEAPNNQAAAAVRHAFCVVQEDEELSPPVLLALSVGRPLVTPAWVEAATTRKAWVEELPPVAHQRPGRLMVPAGVLPGPDGQRPSWLNLADWQDRRSPRLLSAFLLVFDQRDTGDLAEAAAAWGADVTKYGQYGVGGVMAALARPQAGSPGNSRFPVFVRPTQWSGVSEQQQQGEEEGEGEQQPTGPEDGLMAHMNDLQLLDAILSQTTEAIEAARDEFQARHHGPQQQQHRAAAAAGQGGGEDGDATEADETEGEEMEEDAAAAAAGGAVGAAAAAAQQAGVTPAPQPPSSSNPGRPAAPTVSAADGDGWHTHAPGSSTASQKTQARTAGTKRGAAAAAAAASDATGAAAAAPASKRRRTAASPTKTPLDLQRKPTQQQQQQQQQEQQPAPESGAAGNAGTQQQQQQQDGLGLNAEVTVALCVMGPVRQPAPGGAVAAGGPQVPNYKAFRRRGQAQQQQQQQQQQAVLAIGLVAAEAPHLQGPDIDTFLRDEKHRQDRLRKADELFNANLKASKAPPMTKPAARPRKK